MAQIDLGEASARASKNQRICNPASLPSHKPDLSKILPRGVLARAWPGDRVLLGMRVSKLLREELSHYAERVVIQRQIEREQTFPADAFFRTLQQFRVSKVYLALEFAPDGAGVMVNFLHMAVQENLCKNVVVLSLKGVSFPDPNMENFAALLPGFPHLEALNLSSCSISSTGAAALSTALMELRALQVLDLSSNPQFGLDGMESLQEALQSCTRLMALSLQVPCFGFQPISEGVRFCTALRSLTLTSNEFDIFDEEDGASLGGAISQCPHLESFAVDFEGDCDVSEGARALAEGLGHCPGLQRLGLAEAVMGREGLGHLLTQLEGHTSLVVLDLSHAAEVPAEEAGRLAGWVGGLTQLGRLRLERVLGGRGLSVLARACEGLTAIGDLRVPQTPPGDAEGAEDWGAGVEVGRWAARCRRSLRELTLDYVALTSAAVLALRPCSQIRHLSLKGCRLGPPSAEALREVLRGVPGLTFLNLGENKFAPAPPAAAGSTGSRGSTAGGGGCVHPLAVICEGLRECGELVHIGLKETGAGDEGATAVAGILNSLTRLDVLSLKGCGIGGPGAAALAAGVEGCSVELHMAGNPIGAEGQRRLKNFLAWTEDARYGGELEGAEAAGQAVEEHAQPEEPRAEEEGWMVEAGWTQLDETVLVLDDVDDWWWWMEERGLQ